MDTGKLSALDALKNSRKPFPLTALLSLYLKSPRLLYLNYFEGFKQLVEWLAPIDISILSSVREKDYPKIFATYEVQEIAKILKIPITKLYSLLWEMHYGNIPRNTHDTSTNDRSQITESIL